jgi:Xaa-Pro dipeptidase
MQTAWDGARPGVRQCDLMADVMAAQIRGTPEFGGDQTAIHPLILAGEAASTAHPLWNDNVLEDGQTVAFELGGCRKRYNVGLARTVHLGTPSQQLQETAKAVEEGMHAVMAALRADVFAGDVHAAWQKVLDRYGLEKKSRIGYSIGAAYAPDWGEHTLSFRPDEKVAVPENAVVHIILGMWMDGWGMELSETLHVTKTGCDKLADFPQHVHLVQR